MDDFFVKEKLIGKREIGSESTIGKRLKRESQTIKKSCFIYGHITMGGRYQPVLLLIHVKNGPGTIFLEFVIDLRLE